MKKCLFTLVAALGCLIATTAHADEQFIETNCNTQELPSWCNDCYALLTERPNTPGFYVGSFAGVNVLSNVHHSGVRANFNTGYLVGANAGYQFCAYRLEGEFTYRFNSLHSIKSDHQKFKPHAGVKTYSLMANSYWDMNIDFCVRPYIGLGFGYAWNETYVKAHHRKLNHTKRGFAWQAMIGGNYDLTDELILSAEYRYFHTKKDIKDNAFVLAVKYAL